jgi:cytoskeleton protein RodZ
MNQTPENVGSAGGPGERLKRAREQAGLSVERVAKDLYLDARVVRIIEDNKFSELGAPVYAKGYLSRYARLLGVGEQDILALYEQLADAPAAPSLIPHAMGTVPKSRPPLPRWILWVVVGLIIAAGISTLLNLRSSSTGSISLGALISRPLNAPAGTISSRVVPAVTLHFSFTGESWVEVYDVHNQRVLYEMGTANGEREVTALPPLRVVLGAAEVVALKVNSHDIEVPTSSVDAGVTKFVVNADGSVE